jgi:mitochondrial ATPase complex subunit ATP10
MLQPRITAPRRVVFFSLPEICSRCQRQALRRPIALQPPIRPFSIVPNLRLPSNTLSPKDNKDEEPEPDFVPRPLGRPIGFSSPPKPGQNIGIREKKTYTGRTMSERNLEKRKDIVEAWGQNYFRDFKNIRKYRSGKTFMANPRIFRLEAALYFPNLHGDTLAGSGKDTTDVLKGKVSVVNVYSSQWGEGQVQTFTGNKENPELTELLERNKEITQTVDVNVEENSMKAWIVKIFQWRLRRQRKEEDWEKYFVIRKGVSDRIRETIGLLNGRVGYVYLLDENCKIRWAGSGNAEGTEKEDLTRGLKKLIQEYRVQKDRRLDNRGQTPQKSEVESELEAQAVSAGAS